MNCHPRVSTDWDLFASGGSLLYSAWPGRLPAPHLAVHSRAEDRVQTQVGWWSASELHACSFQLSRPGCIGVLEEDGWARRRCPGRLDHITRKVMSCWHKESLPDGQNHDSSLSGGLLFLELRGSCTF